MPASVQAGEADALARQRGLPLLCKRVVDITVAVLVLVATAPVLLVVALGLGLSQGRPILFKQRRSGWRERPFTIYKFRTMRNAVSPDGKPLDDAQRLTRIGKVLRRLSIDELPQLINVLRGELSLIGNRPLPVEYLERMTPEQRRRYQTLPGMTGIDTVRGRYGLSWAEQLALDLWYVDHWSLWLDFKTTMETIYILVLNKDQLPEENPVREEFMGTGDPQSGASSSEGCREAGRFQ